MKILIGPDSFKDSVSANEFCEIAKSVILKNWPDDDVVYLPLADGGEGTVDALVKGQGGVYVQALVTGPLGKEVNATYGLIDENKVAVIEMAEASGLPLVPIELRDPMKTTTYGTGELIIDALSKGVKKIIIGIGGSATNDAGIGMLQALGFKCLNEEGLEVSFGGEGLLDLKSIIKPLNDQGEFKYEDIDFQVACDVTSPLYGPYGAAHIYGPQKGGDEQTVKILDEGLRNFANIVEKSLEIDVHTLKGGGAAGGLGACLYSALKAKLEPGFKIIKKQVDLLSVFESGIDIVITAEGQMNQQSLNGKLPVELAKLGTKYGAKTIAIVGAREIDLEEVKAFGIIGVFPIANKPMSLIQSMENGKELIKGTLEQVLNLVHEIN